jgi:hypothetical protein
MVRMPALMPLLTLLALAPAASAQIITPQPDAVVVDSPVVYGQGRQLGVRPSRASDTSSWAYFSPFEEPPPTPDQRDILLTSADSLIIAVPMFQFRPALARFAVSFSRNGDQLTLEGYTLRTGGFTRTIYGPGEYLHRIDPLPPGHYTLTVHHYRAIDLLQTNDSLTTFQADPLAYAQAHDLSLAIVRQQLQFTVVPEPAAFVPLAVTALALGRRRSPACRRQLLR